MILEHVTTHLMHDEHVEVRELCLRVLIGRCEWIAGTHRIAGESADLQSFVPPHPQALGVSLRSEPASSEELSAAADQAPKHQVVRFVRVLRAGRFPPNASLWPHNEPHQLHQPPLHQVPNASILERSAFHSSLSHHRKTIRVSSRAFTIFSSTTPTPAPFSSRRAWKPRDWTAFWSSRACCWFPCFSVINPRFSLRFESHVARRCECCTLQRSRNTNRNTNRNREQKREAKAIGEGDFRGGNYGRRTANRLGRRVDPRGKRRIPIEAVPFDLCSPAIDSKRQFGERIGRVQQVSSHRTHCICVPIVFHAE